MIRNITKPTRIQLSRQKGFNLQEYSKSINGLPAVKCDRSTKWGNPMSKTKYEKDWYGIEYQQRKIVVHLTKTEVIKKSIELFENLIKENTDKIIKARGNSLEFEKEYVDIDNYIGSSNRKYILNIFSIKKHLKGKNLACLCKPDEPCHCDILLKIANED